MNLLDGLKNTIYVDKELSDYYSKLKKYDLSIDYLKKILETTVNISNIIESNKLVHIDDSFNLEQIIEETQNNLIKQHFYYAEDCFKNNLIEKAINLYKYVLTSNTDCEFIFYKLGLCFKKLGQIDSALLFFNKSVSYNNKYYESYKELGDIYYNLKNDLYKCAFYYENFINKIKNDYAVYSVLGFIYNRIGNIKKSFYHLQKANELNPNNELTISNLLFTLQKIPDLTQKEIYEFSKNIIDEYSKTQNIEKFNHKRNTVTKNKKIHIAYISGDFHDHVIMLYLLPILENHDKEKFIVSCYSNNNEENDDIYSIKAEMNSQNFINISKLNNKEVANLIYDDEVDLLIDLSGHTAKTRIFCTLYKPAPIIISYMGFPNTTGIDEVDYFLSNKNLNRCKENEFYSEQVFKLDSCYRIFKPSVEEFPEIKEIPYLKNNYITFGVFNDLSKINESVVEVWAKILKKIPNSKIYICRTTIIEEFLLNMFKNFGIGEDRLIFDKKFEIKKYNLIDIHLDTFPYSGVTVIFDSLIMGVPTLTIKGETFAGREAYNINKYLNLDDFNSINEGDYINKAIKISKNILRLKDLKINLRPQLIKSDFFNYSKFTTSLENFYIEVYNKYISKQFIE